MIFGYSQTCSNAPKRDVPETYGAVRSAYQSFHIGFTVAFSGILGFFVFLTDFLIRCHSHYKYL